MLTSLLLLTTLPAHAAKVTDLPPQWRGDFGIGYGVTVIPDSLVEDEVRVGNRRSIDHQIDYTGRLGFTDYLAVEVVLPHHASSRLRFSDSNRMVYDLVGPHRLVNGVSLWRVSASPMMIFGSLLIGVIIDWVGIWGAFAFMAASLAIGLPFLLFIHVHGSVDSSSSSLFRQTLEGAQLAVRDPSLRTLFSVSVVMETLGFSFLVMIPVMAKNVLETTGTGLGFLHAGVGAGMLGATLLMAAYGDSVSKAKIIVVCATGAGVALVAFALSRSLPLSVVLAGAVMGFLNAYDLSLGAMMQLVSPPHLRGRAVSLHSLAISFTALGGFVIGAVGGVVGVPLVMAVSGGGIIANIALRKRAILGLQERSIESHPL